jgi:hypothetical protein
VNSHTSSLISSGDNYKSESNTRVRKEISCSVYLMYIELPVRCSAERYKRIFEGKIKLSKVQDILSLTDNVLMPG